VSSIVNPKTKISPLNRTGTQIARYRLDVRHFALSPWPHLAAAAFLAISQRRLPVRASARATPLTRPPMRPILESRSFESLSALARPPRADSFWPCRQLTLSDLKKHPMSAHYMVNPRPEEAKTSGGSERSH